MFVMTKLKRAGVDELELAAFWNVVWRKVVASILLASTRCNLSTLLITIRRPELLQKKWISLSERQEEADRFISEGDVGCRIAGRFDAATREPLCVIYVKPLRR